MIGKFPIIQKGVRILVSNKKQNGTYKTLLFAGPRKIEFRELAAAELKADEVRIETMYSGISRDTEMTIYRGNSPFYEKTFGRV